MIFRVLTLFLSVTLVSSAIIDAATFANITFDFIIAGGGTAGVAVAVRLSEIANFTVGIIEAGTYKEGDPKILIPQGWNSGKVWGDPDYDWLFSTIPQKNLDNRSLAIVRGKALGGSSAINLMGVFLAGAVEYDQIGSLGNPGWSYETTLKYFKKATNFTKAPKYLQVQEHATYDPQFHGTDGPVHVSFSSWFSWCIPPFYNALVKLGFAPVYDGSDGQDSGTVWNPPLGIVWDNKTRSYSAAAYYAPNAARPNLHVVTSAQVAKIELSSKPDSSGNVVATGVTYISGNQTYTAAVTKEVIVSAGSIQSPHVLELSGIGNKTLLESVGIQSRVDLPAVGENFVDHFLNWQVFTVPNTIETLDVLNDPVKNATVFAQYENNRTGPYTSSVTAIAFQSAARILGNDTQLAEWLAELDQQFNASNPSAGRRRVYEIERARLLPNSSEASLEFYAAPANAYPAFYQPNTSYIQLASILLHPFSRGSIHLNTTDPLAHPRIDMNAWSFSIDKHLDALSTQYIRKVSVTKPLSPIIDSLVYPGANVSTPAQWEDWAVGNALSAFHPCCTSSMMPKEDGGVVSPKLKVYGTANIRVADASILPMELGTHLAGTVYSIAEQAADMIKADWGH